MNNNSPFYQNRYNRNNIGGRTLPQCYFQNYIKWISRSYKIINRGLLPKFGRLWL